MNTTTTTIDLQAGAVLPVMTALGLAVVRRAERIHAIALELDELAREGVFCPYDARELWALESVGLQYDFETGMIREEVSA